MTPIEPSSPGPPSTSTLMNPFQRLVLLADDEPATPILTFVTNSGVSASLTRREFIDLVNQRVSTIVGALRKLEAVEIAEPNTAELFALVVAAWALGATPLISAPQTSPEERGRLAQGYHGSWDAVLKASESHRLRDSSGPYTKNADARLVTEPRFAWYLASGGTSGMPEYVPVFGQPSNVLEYQRRKLEAMRWTPGMTQLVCGPLYHAAPFSSAIAGLVYGGHLVVTDSFSPRSIQNAVSAARIDWCQLTPDQMALIPSMGPVLGALQESLAGMMHVGSACPPLTKRQWITYLGTDRIFEMYSSTQLIGGTICDGRDWLRKPGTVGRPFLTKFRVRRENGQFAQNNEVGELYMNNGRLDGETFSDLKNFRTIGDGYFSSGDMGYIDVDGYVFVTGRVDDAIRASGHYVSPTEVEAVIQEIPAVKEVVVVGRKHAEFGQAVHAVIALNSGQSLSYQDVIKQCSEKLLPYKIPISVDFVDQLERTHAGKIARYLYRDRTVTAR